MKSPKITAKAHTNIALIKYWGKRDTSLFLPQNSSLSLTLDRFYTLTKVWFDDELSQDRFWLDGQEGSDKDWSKIHQFLNLVRDKAGIKAPAYVESINHVPTAAGMASSASAFAALAAAASKAAGLQLSIEELSSLARRGSGSACRSLQGGFVKWDRGIEEDGSDSYAHQILGEDVWEIAILSVLVTRQTKKVSSRKAMYETVETSPYYPAWVSSIPQDMALMEKAIGQKDLDLLGQTAERNALKMHASMMASANPIIYFEPATIGVMQTVKRMREVYGISVYYTIDAGPNIKVICAPKDEKVILEKLEQCQGVEEILTCRPGPGVAYMR